MAAWLLVLRRLLLLLLLACCCWSSSRTSEAAARRFPRHIYPRDPQAFSVHIPVPEQKLAKTQAFVGVNRTTSSKVHLSAFSVFPDTQVRKAYVLFSYREAQWKPFVAKFPLETPSCHHPRQCANLLEHFTSPWFGNIRCQFERPNGTVLESAPARVRAHSATISTASVFVGTCDLPAEFVELVEQDDFANPPKIRLLRERDVTGVPAGVDPRDPAAVFEAWTRVQCTGFQKVEASSKDACEQDCLHSVNLHEGKRCTVWRWTDKKGCYQSSQVRMRHCKPSNTTSFGGRRRFDAWDAVETSRLEKKLITFGCSMPVYGDGSYMNMIPQWLEFQLLNFPDTHFFFYLRGGDGLGGYENTANVIPGVVGGVAALHPYIEAGVATVVWLPPDRENLLVTTQNSFQKRDENDFLYRAKHLSKWISASVDFDEYFGPTCTVDAEYIAQQSAGSVLHQDGAVDVDWTGSDGETFYPVGVLLDQVSPDVHMLTFRKWPAEIPNLQSHVYLDTQTIATDSTHGHPGKYILRPADARLMYTHMPIVAEQEGGLDEQHTGHLILGNTEYNLLHFRERDWAVVANFSKDHKPYTLTQSIALAVKERLWLRYHGEFSEKRR